MRDVRHGFGRVVAEVGCLVPHFCAYSSGSLRRFLHGLGHRRLRFGHFGGELADVFAVNAAMSARIASRSVWKSFSGCGVREDSPPKMVSVVYELIVDTDEVDRRLELLHTNVRKFGTISNTMSAATSLEGAIRRKV